jgi:hypothetical protein
MISDPFVLSLSKDRLSFLAMRSKEKAVLRQAQHERDLG